ncbi:unnamed protein product (macronuclear) [Paramecium tetraurelia]|uniref:Protein kinase domain-containing protein n=1 Tax=Paramecium tetraurelia TaxID=5888 RepID=A0CA82_PARTE|nr:uncharacterized protein GSPATT00036479001 [Paramecium tetraurelia]CAK67699.1 unnamed protein product [Paramecium tetraurelia]|eukprot:XP_001435096.1 hypothetical protein (macronuclear) [Paramecium tetraurelia strain d4-2]
MNQIEQTGKKSIIKNSEPIQISHYQIDKKKFYGKGQYGAVYGCSDIQNPDLQLCAKVLKVEDVDQLILKREVEIIQMLMPIQRENQNLIQVFEVFNEKSHGSIYIIMELCKEGDLKQLLDKRKKKNQPFTIDEAINIVAQIANGYKTLYKSRIIHRDIKPANILIQNGVFKIADLGMGRVIEDMNYAQNFTKVGTPAYAAPQLFLESKFSSKADVYSLGVIFYQLIYGQLPIQANTQPELLQKLRNLKATPKQCDEQCPTGIVPQNVRQLIQQMLYYDEHERCSWMDVFQSDILRQILSETNQTQTPTKTTQVFHQQKSGPTNYQQYYRVNDISDNKILHMIRILTNKSDFAKKCHKHLQDQKSLQTAFNLKTGELILLSLCISGYRYKLIQNILGLLLNQFHQLIPQLQAIITPEELKENFKINDSISKRLKEYIQKTLNASILQFREDECKFFNSCFQINQLQVQEMKKVLEQDDDTNYLFFAQSFQFFFTSFENSFTQNINEPNNQELLSLLKSMINLETDFSIMESLNKCPSKILQETNKFS